MGKRALLPLLLLAGLPATAEAGVITGRVVDSQGNPVPGVNIDAEGAITPTITNGGTGSDGTFTTTIEPDGVYDLLFKPPPPPATTHLVGVIEGVTVTGVVNLGDVVLPPGVALSGRALQATNGSPVPGVDLDVEVGGKEIPVVNDVTNALGQFLIAVPTGTIQLQLETESVGSPLLAPEALELVIGGTTNLGDVALDPGFFVSLIVKRQSNGAAVVSADLDVIDVVTKQKLFTPGDNTDAAGFVDVVVPAGTYDVEVCPQFPDLLVATTLLSKTITSSTFLGTILLADGVVLSGNVVGPLGLPQQGVDVDLDDPVTGLEVTLCGDDTDASGNYAVVVPTGTFDVEFDPPPQLGLCSNTVFGVVISGNTTLNTSLPAGATVYCTSKASSIPGCVPTIAADCTASLSGGPGGADVLCGPVPGGTQPAILVYTTKGAAASPANTPFGFMCVQTGPGFFRVTPPKFPGGSPGTCSGAYTFDYGTYLAGPNPDPNLVPGAAIDAQAWYRDPSNPGGANLSNAIQFQLVP